MILCQSFQFSVQIKIKSAVSNMSVINFIVWRDEQYNTGCAHSFKLRIYIGITVNLCIGKANSLMYKLSRRFVLMVSEIFQNTAYCKLRCFCSTYMTAV